MKIIKQFGFVQLVKLNEPVFGGYYAVINCGNIKDGLSLDAANDLYYTLKKLSIYK